MKYIIIFLILIIFLIPGAVVHGLELNKNLPKPVQDVLNTAEKVQLNVDTGKVINELKNTAETGKIDPGRLFGDLGIDLKGLWDKINGWVKNTIGVSLGEIVKALGNLFVWFFELVIKFVKWIVSIV